MREIFVDAVYWIALANPADQWHSAAKKFDEDNSDALLITTEEVLTEFLNYYAESGSRRRRIVGSMCAQVLTHPNITVLLQSHESFTKGFQLYRQREDKGYSLTDCISMVSMLREGMREVLTRDHHFEQEGFSILL